MGNLHRTARHVIPRQSGYFMSHAIELRKLGRALLLTKKREVDIMSKGHSTGKHDNDSYARVPHAKESIGLFSARLAVQTKLT